ncbi:hypothetical protein NA57DRAFT_76015 [Rhizodiscina lignyota]|uniref:F-box domain-containing protein n=1 Tax=Rhizodiscina lignyota TaxID=1504668 RepID=A0A9P4IIG1_9PEZI|nr:hypothetical protein NA57DRAFT_76015 [Rhizodiscina lignyota]
MPSGMPNKPLKRKIGFFDLPAEIRDLIYEYSFPPKNYESVITPRRCVGSPRCAFVIDSHLNRLDVRPQLKVATKVRNHRFQHEYLSHLFATREVYIHLVYLTRVLRFPHLSIHLHITELVIACGGIEFWKQSQTLLDALWSLPKLKHLTLMELPCPADEYELESYERTNPCISLAQWLREFFVPSLIKTLLKLRLESFHLSSYTCLEDTEEIYHGPDPDYHCEIEEVIRSLESVIREHITQPHWVKGNESRPYAYQEDGVPWYFGYSIEG